MLKPAMVITLEVTIHAPLDTDPLDVEDSIRAQLESTPTLDPAWHMSINLIQANLGSFN